jgi:acyl-CoA synthetase (AMP-forming)/AMP-acid ligase II
MNIISRFERFANLHPDKPVYIYFRPQKKDWETVTYSQLSESIQRFAGGLMQAGLTPGMTALLLTPPSQKFFPLLFAMLKTGIIPIIVDPLIGLKNFDACLAEVKPDIFIGNKLTHTLRVLFGWGKRSIRHNLTIESIERLSQQAAPVSGNHNSETAAIIYTSGSTGISKGVIVSHENFAAELEMLIETFNISADEIDLPAFPLYVLIDAMIGATAIIPDISFPVPKKTNPQKVIDAARTFHVTNMFASPVVLDLLARYGIPKGVKLTSLKRIITAGAPAPIPLQAEFRKMLPEDTALFGIYGATEVLPIAKIESRELFALTDRTAQGAGVCLGRPVNGATVRVIAISEAEIPVWDDAIEVRSNVIGEITVQGKAVTERYLARANANRLAKIDHADGIIHRMGDAGYFDDDGRLWYCGRKAHRVITADDVLFTEQIEGIFNMHPLVYRTALVGAPHPIVWVELKTGMRVDENMIRRELICLAKDHPQASRITEFLFAKKFPTDVRHNSKIIREVLAQKARGRVK